VSHRRRVSTSSAAMSPSSCRCAVNTKARLRPYLAVPVSQWHRGDVGMSDRSSRLIVDFSRGCNASNPSSVRIDIQRGFSLQGSRWVDVDSSPAAPPIQQVEVKDEAEDGAERQHARFYFLDSYRREKFRNYRPADASSNHLAVLAPGSCSITSKIMKCSSF